jgi:hypothetical protein
MDNQMQNKILKHTNILEKSKLTSMQEVVNMQMPHLQLPSPSSGVEHG